LGFGGGDAAPKFDNAGRAVSGLSGSTSGRDGGLPLAALQAIAVAAGVGQAAGARTPTIRAEASKSKAAKTLEVMAEVRAVEPQFLENQAPQNKQQYGGGYDAGGRGRGGYSCRMRGGGGNGGRGGGRSNYAGVSNYGPHDGKTSDVPPVISVLAKEKEEQPESITKEDWQRQLQAYEQGVPQSLEEVSSLADMRALRRAALKEAKKFRAARQVHRLQRKRLERERVSEVTAAKQEACAQRAMRKEKSGYRFVKRGVYGDVELVNDSRCPSCPRWPAAWHRPS
jgi:hypothetical protein